MCCLKRSTCSCVSTPRWSTRGTPGELGGWEKPWDDPSGSWQIAKAMTSGKDGPLVWLFIAQSLGAFIGGSIQILSDHFGGNDSQSLSQGSSIRDWHWSRNRWGQGYSRGSKIRETSRDSLCTKISRTGPDEINDSEEKIASHSHHPHHPHSIHVHSNSQEKPAISPLISRLRYLSLPEAHCTVGRRADVPSSASVIAVASRMDLPPGPTTVDYVPSSYGSCGTIEIWFYMFYISYRWLIWWFLINYRYIDI